MKIVKIAQAFAAALLVLAVSCNDGETTKPAPEVKTAEADQTDKTLAILHQSYNRFKEREDKRLASINRWAPDVTKPVDFNLARLYVSHYKEQHRVTPGNVASESRTEAVWVDREAIEAFMYTLMNDKTLTGIRFYYSQYTPKVSTEDPRVSAEYNGRQMLIFVATKDSAGGHYDYFRSTDGKRSDGLYIYDYNSLCPNDCKGATIGLHD